jgi:hypothetical protein
VRSSDRRIERARCRLGFSSERHDQALSSPEDNEQYIYSPTEPRIQCVPFRLIATSPTMVSDPASPPGFEIIQLLIFTHEPRAVL